MGVPQVTRCQANKNVNVSVSTPIEVTPQQMKSLKLRPVSGAAVDSAVALEQLNALTPAGELASPDPAERRRTAPFAFLRWYQAIPRAAIPATPGRTGHADRSRAARFYGC